jgi:hypothetical protein
VMVRSVIRSASAVVTPFSSSTASVWLKLSTVELVTNGPAKGRRSSQASVAARPAAVRRHCQNIPEPSTPPMTTSKP